MLRYAICTSALMLALPCLHLSAQQPEGSNTRARAISLGIDFLTSRAQAADGSFTGHTGTGITSLVVTSVLQNRSVALNSPAIQKSLKYLESHFKADGGIYMTDSLYRNYETSLAIGALVLANKDGRYDKRLKMAEAFLRGIQWDEGEGLESSDPGYGGAGYGKHGRPDMSNTTFYVEALRNLGAKEDDEGIQKALKFLSRAQNLESEHNDTPHAAKVNDGGFYYTPAAGGQSQAGQTANGGLRSYGSMTYAGLKSMIYAGVGKDDQRVKAALRFIRNNYSLKQNPGMGDAGLYYYYHTFAKALDAAELDSLEDAAGESHNWRKELVSTLTSLQQTDGAWVNRDNDRWLEGDPSLVTAYALLALSYCEE